HLNRRREASLQRQRNAATHSSVARRSVTLAIRSPFGPSRGGTYTPQRKYALTTFRPIERRITVTGPRHSERSLRTKRVAFTMTGGLRLWAMWWTITTVA